jgi:PAS domain S-box-containing protein
MKNLIDVTESIKAEELLYQSRGRLIRGESVSKSGNWELHLDSGVITASQGACRLYGLIGEMWSFEMVKDIPLPEYRDLLDRSLSQLVNNAVPYDIEFKIRQKISGRILDIHSIAEYDSKERILFGVLQDITDRKKTENALLESEERFRSLFEGSPDAIFLADSETGIILDTNHTACQLTGKSREELIGIHQSQLHPARCKNLSKGTFYECVLKSTQKNENHLVESYLLNSDGSEIPVQILSSSFILNNRQVIQGVFRSATCQDLFTGAKMTNIGQWNISAKGSLQFPGIQLLISWNSKK